jgi:Na+-transporting NADH:ubiquinone oxidoreductase subunit C
VVILRPIQAVSRERSRIETIIAAAGFTGYSDDIFEQFVPLIVNLETGEYRKESDPERWYAEFPEMIRDPERCTIIPKGYDIAAIKMMPKEMMVYVLYNNDKPSIAILPMYGSGLWSVMHSYLAVDLASFTVAGIRFSEHGETPGLGGEIDNIRWQTNWQGKKIYDYQDKPRFFFSKSPIRPDSEDAQHTVDAISGATLTTDGVKNTLYFWLSDMGYRNFLTKMNEEAQ